MLLKMLLIHCLLGKLFHHSSFAHIFARAGSFIITYNKLFILCFRDISYNQITGEIPYNIGFLQVATLYVHFYL